jgi:hypothetical protein
MNDVDLLAKMGTDAAKWATEYEQRFSDETPDWGTLVGWFANAIEAGRAAAFTPRCEQCDDTGWYTIAAAEFERKHGVTTSLSPGQLMSFPCDHDPSGEE